MTQPKMNQTSFSNDALLHSIDARMHGLFQRIESNAQSAKTPPSSPKSKTIQSGLTEEDIAQLQTRYFRLNFTLDSILKKLENSIIGQTEGIKDILFAVYNNQYVNMLDDISATNLPIKRIQVLVAGPSGVGKTKAISKIAELFNVPYIKFNATQLTASGYVGSDVNIILSSLVEAANGDFEAAQRGIIFIDEVDKKVSAEANNTSGRDINGTAVQEELLKLLEPSIIYLGSKHVPFDTKYLTVIVGGRFKGLDEIRESRLRGEKRMGFSSNENSENIQKKETKLIPEDFIKLGFLDEFIGRFHIITEFKRLSFEDNLNIIFAEDSIFQQYMQIFHSKDVTLYIDPIHFTQIAEEISNSPTGARHLEMKILRLLQPLLYQVEQHHSPGVCEIDYDGNYFWMFEDSTSNF